MEADHRRILLIIFEIDGMQVKNDRCNKFLPFM